MIKSLENVSDTRKRISVEIPADVVEQRIQEALRDVSGRVSMPGFRQGRAPISMIEKKYGPQVESDIVEKLVSEYYMKAMKESKLTPAASPDFEKADFKRKNPLTMTFTVEVMPEIKDLSYEGLELKDEQVEVTDEEMDNALMRARAERVSYDAVDRPVEDNDLVTLNYEIEGDEKKREGQVVKVGSGQFPKEFFDALKGKTKGESFEATVAFPEGHLSEFKGRTVAFRGTVKEIKVLSLPELNEEFAKQLGYQDLAAMKETFRTAIASAKKRHIRKRQIVELIDKLIETHDFPLPERMLEGEINELLTSEKAKEENRGIGDEELRARIMPKARKNVKASVLLTVIGEKENVSVTEEDLKAKILELSQATFIAPRNLVEMYMQRDGSLEGLRYGVFKEKVAELIHSRAKVAKGE